MTTSDGSDGTDQQAGDPPGDEQNAIDRAFAAIMAGYHLTADEVPTPGPVLGPEPPERPSYTPTVELPPDPPPERWVAGPVDPLPRPTLPILLGWVGLSYAVGVAVLLLFGVPLPRWMGWTAVGGFLGAFGVLLLQLPRTRPPDAGDGAVL